MPDSDPTTAIQRDQLLGLLKGSGEDADTLKILSLLLAEFSHSLDVHETLLQVTRIIKPLMRAEGVSLFLLSDDASELICKVCSSDSDITGVRFAADLGIIGRCIRHGRVELVADTADDPDFFTGVDSMTGTATKSILCAPLRVGSAMLGALEVINKEGGNRSFNARDQQLLSALADAAALAIHNAHMAQQLVDEERTRHELRLAREIQEAFLPDDTVTREGIAGINMPARSVSGDFYDFFRVAPDRYYFCLGDVSGKGVNASLLVSRVSALFRLLAKAQEPPARLLATINRELAENSSRGMFVTMVAGIYQPSAGHAVLANAGHQPPLQYEGDALTAHEVASPPLGILEDTEFAEYAVDLGAGALYLFSDGLTECWVKPRRALGEDGVRTLIRNYNAYPLASRLQKMLDEVTAWKRRSSGYLHDDITVLAIDPTAGG